MGKSHDEREKDLLHFPLETIIDNQTTNAAQIEVDARSARLRRRQECHWA